MSENKIEFDYQTKLNELLELENTIKLTSVPEQKANVLFKSFQLNMLIAFRLFAIGDPDDKCLNHYFKALKAYKNLGEALSDPSLQGKPSAMHMLEIANQKITEQAPFFDNILKATESLLQTKIANIAKLTAAKKYNDAHKVLTKLLSENPNCQQIIIAQLFINTKLKKFTESNFQQAQLILNNSAQAEPSLSPEELCQLEYCVGFGYYHKDKYDLAAEHFLRASSENPAIQENMPELLGICRFKQMEACIQELDNPKLSPAQQEVLSRQRDGYAEIATNLLKKVKNNATSAYSVARILDLCGNTTDAMIYYLKAKKTKEKSLKLLPVHLGNLYLEAQNYPEAIKEYSGYLDKAEKGSELLLIQDITLRRSVAYARSGNIEKALCDLMQALGINPGNPICAISTQKLLAQNKSKISSANSGPDLQPMIATAEGIMQVFAEEDMQLIIEDLENYLKPSTDRLMQSIVYCLIGHIQASQLKNLDKAIEAYQKAQAKSPLSADEQTRLTTLTNLAALRAGRENRLHTPAENKDTTLSSDRNNTLGAK